MPRRQTLKAAQYEPWTRFAIALVAAAEDTKGSKARSIRMGTRVPEISANQTDKPIVSSIVGLSLQAGSSFPGPFSATIAKAERLLETRFFLNTISCSSVERLRYSTHPLVAEPHGTDMTPVRKRAHEYYVQTWSSER